MNASTRRRWLLMVIVVGAIYFVIGIVSAALANSAASVGGREAWRRMAFVASAVVFGAHIAYEHFRLGHSPRSTAAHAALAVALGSFGLAVAANVHGYRVGSSHQGALALSLVVWPLLGGLPAYVVAYLAAAGLALRRRRA